MLIISYATENQKYLNFANRLIQNFADVGYNSYHITYYPEVKTKMEGCLIKPSFILDQLLYHKKPVLCIDIDSIIIKKPTPFYCDNYDIGFVYTPEKKNIITNGIHLWGYTNNSIKFLERWKKLCNNNSLHTLDHKRLIQVFFELGNEIDWINIRKCISDWFIAELNENEFRIRF